MVDALTAERLAELRAAAKYDDARYPHHWATNIFPGDVIALLDEVEKARKHYDFYVHWYHVRFRRLRILCEDAGLLVPWSNIVANGTADVHEPHLRDCHAVAERDALQKRLDSAEIYNNAVEEERKRIGLQLHEAKQEWAERCKRQEAGLRAALARAEKAEAALREIKGASRSSGDGLATQVGGPLNPTWVEWLMGYPPEDK